MTKNTIVEPAVPGPWYCVLDPEWLTLYLGTDRLAAAAAATPGAVVGRAPRMGDAMSAAALAVGRIARTKGAA